MKRTFSLIEYEPFSVDILKSQGFNEEEAKRFYKEISIFAQENQNQFLAYSRKGCLKAQNYVGVIQTKSGFILEILPKISIYEDKEQAKNILIKMLKTLKDSPFRNYQKASLKTSRLTLWEIFIQMFLDELEYVIKKGLKNDYILKQKNEKFLKGKLNIHKQLTTNIIHKEYFYIEYDEYLPNRIENKILKTTLIKLYSLTTSYQTQKRIREYLFIFDNIEKIYNIKLAFDKVNIDRTIQYYSTAILWSKLFLLNKSFTPYSGNTIAFALLFDMNKIFEAYVGQFFKKNYKNIKLQDAKHYLFDKPKKYKLKPDIVINNGEKIFDTKWKLIKDQKDISQTDLYQMFAYASKYDNCKKVTIIYPLIDNSLDINYNTTINNRNIRFQIAFFDLNSDTITPSVANI